MPTVIGIIGSYREGGINDQAVTEVLAGAAEAGATTRRVFLPDLDIAFCTNCRTCMQAPGDDPGRCIHHDAMGELLDAVVRADGLVLASPQNMGTVTAVMKRFIERCAPMAHWPWGAPAPRTRQAPPKSIVLIASGAAPTFLWGLGGFTAHRTLRTLAKMMHPTSMRMLKYGMVSRQEHPTLTAAQRAAARAAGRRLVTG